MNTDAATATEAASPEESEEESGPVRVRTFADVKDTAARAIRYVTSSSSCHKTVYYVRILLSYYYRVIYLYIYFPLGFGEPQSSKNLSAYCVCVCIIIVNVYLYSHV